MRRGRLLLLAAAALACLWALPSSAGAKTVWLCKPGKADDACDVSLNTTRFSPSGKRLGVELIKRPKRPRYDCFYVYPTVSDQKSATANFEDPGLPLTDADRLRDRVLDLQPGPAGRFHLRPDRHAGARGALHEPRRAGRRLGQADPDPAQRALRPRNDDRRGGRRARVPEPAVSTAWRAFPGSYRGRCSSAGGADVLAIGSIGDAPVFSPSPTKQWGLHLVDANIALGEIVDVVRAQGAAWRADHR